MNLFLVLLYYSVVAIGICFYLIQRSKELAISDFVMIGITVLFSFSGVIIAYGIPFGYLNLDVDLYILYTLFSILVPLGLIWGKNIKISKYRQYFEIADDKVINLYIFFIALYACGYFYVIREKIPLLLLLTGSGSRSVKIARLQVTHNITSYFKLPVILRYYNIVFDYMSLYIFAILLVKYLNNKGRYRFKFWSYAVLEFILMFYATEKAPFIYLLIIIVYCIYAVNRSKHHNDIINSDSLYYDRRAKRKIRFFIFIGSVAFLFLYTAFMGIEDANNGIMSIVSRAFVNQSSGTYLQKKILDAEYNGCLYGKGIPILLVDSIIGRTTVNLSRDVYSSLFSSYTSLGGGGTSGSLAIFELYSNFGMVLSILITLIVAITTGAVDNKTDISIYTSTEKEIPIALKAILIVVFFKGYLGHFQTFLALPFIVSLEIIVILFMTWTFTHVKVKK